ncbi:unnamed protein product [Symbiodinium pilosum]|uniref:Uncharacterized protein n=1 Tax=Symbiodinium pilosum TaxID=2952 RepID=A0A812LZ37_SYMPI|nr:unnamed protein product [Symbiodinium pilosum]
MTEGRWPPPTKAPGLEEWRQRLEAAFRRSATAPALASLVPESTRASSCSGPDGPDGCSSSACDLLDESPGFAEAGQPAPAVDAQWEEDFLTELYRLDLERLESEQCAQAEQLERLERLPLQDGGLELQRCRESLLALRQAHEELRVELAAVIRASPAAQAAQALQAPEALQASEALQGATTGCLLQ